MYFHNFDHKFSLECCILNYTFIYLDHIFTMTCEEYYISILHYSITPFGERSFWLEANQLISILKLLTGLY